MRSIKVTCSPRLCLCPSFSFLFLSSISFPSNLTSQQFNFTTPYQSLFSKMFGNISNWFSSKQESSQEDTWNAMTVQTHQPTSPDAPSTDRVVTEQPVRFSILLQGQCLRDFNCSSRPYFVQNSEQNMKLRGGGAGDVCCGL